MGKVSSYHEAPYQGVSQASPQVRLKTQAQTLDNCLVPIPEGCIKRPPFSWLGHLQFHSGDSNGVFALVTRSGAAPDVILTVANLEPNIYDLANLTHHNVTVSSNAQDYINTADPALSSLRVTSIVDDTFLTSNQQIVGNVTTRNAARNPEGMLWVRASAYARKYSVTVTKSGGSPVTVTLTTPNGAATTDAPYVDTDAIAAALLSGSGYSVANGASVSGNLNSLTGSGFTVSRIGAVIYLSCATDFTIDVEDGQGGTAFIAVKDKVQRFSDLPQKVPVDGFVVRIVQQSDDTRDDFFVKFHQTAGKGTGTWEECLAPNALLGLDTKTMPMLLFNDGTWKLQEANWLGRTTGDENLVPDPDFIGQAIEDVTYWRGRLALIAGEGVTLSAADNPFRTYPRSLSTVLDSDPIARVNPSPGVAHFRYAAAFQSRLVVFGDTAEGGIQAEVTADGVLTPGKADIDTMASYPFLPAIRPQLVGSKAYFMAPRTSFAMVYELEVDKVTSTAQADDMSAAVPKYVPNTVDLVASSPTLFMTAYAQSGASTIYLHLYRTSQEQRIQNAWQRWTIPTGWFLGGMFFKGTNLYVLVTTGFESHVLVCDVSPAQVDTGGTLLSHWDFRVKETQFLSIAYDSATDITTLQVPYPLYVAPHVSVRGAGSGVDRPEGLVVDVLTWVFNGTITLQGDWRTVPLWAGLAYEQRWEPSTIFVMGQDDKPRLDGRLQLNRLKADLAETGYVRVEVTNKGRATRKTEFEGVTADDPSSFIDKPPSFTGSISVPIGGQNIQTTIAFVNDSHLPSGIVGFEWFGEFNARSGRV